MNSSGNGMKFRSWHAEIATITTLTSRCSTAKITHSSCLSTTTCLQAAAKAKSAATTSTRQYSVVVHGPPGIDLKEIQKRQRKQQTKKKKSKKSSAASAANGATTTDWRPYKLVIVESPSKCKTISTILQKYVTDNNLEYDFVVTSSMGHVRNIPKRKQQRNKKTTKTKKQKKDSNNNNNNNNDNNDHNGIEVVPGIRVVAGRIVVNDATNTAQSGHSTSTIYHNYIPTYEIIPGKEGIVEELKILYDASQQLIIATDPDREGEAIGWHLVQLMEATDQDEMDTDLLPMEMSLSTSSSTTSESRDPTVRVTFSEITPKAIIDAIEHPQPSIRYNLVQAQETRRILDRLAGFTVSPVLWKKISPGLSAGRVQSVGMALIVQRERERLAFKETEYCSIKANFTSSQDDNKDDLRSPSDGLVEAQLVSVNGMPLAAGTTDFNPRQSNQLTASSSHKLHLQEEQASDLVALIKSQDETVESSWTWMIQAITTSQRNINPPLPFITSSLQQEANRRLGLGVRRVMEAAQQLYEQGYISYMRTDSKHLSADAHAAIKSEVVNHYGGIDKYVFRNDTTTGGGRTKKQKSNKKPDPQAAHEAIRPAIQPSGMFCQPQDLPTSFDTMAQKLYTLIYQRTVASQMSPQVSNVKSITINGTNDEGNDGTSVVFKASGSTIVDAGFRAVYSASDHNSSQELPADLEEGQRLDCQGALSRLHCTQPPARYTEASFVGELEALGVGRPSTYASTVAILRERAYVASSSTKEASGGSIVARRAAGESEALGNKGSRSSMAPSLTAMVVTSLLEEHCNMYVDPSFTARMEERLDEIANADPDSNQAAVRNSYLHQFYQGGGGEPGLAAQIKAIEDSVDPDDARRVHLPSLESVENGERELNLFVGPWGPFIVEKKKSSLSECEDDEDSKPLTASLPPGMAADLTSITPASLDAVIKSKEENGSVVGFHPDDGRVIKLKTGSYGAYLQWGEDDDETPKPTTHTLPETLRNMKNLGVDHEVTEGVTLHELLGISLEDAVKYCGLPREVCRMDDKPIIAAIGPYGPYLKYNNTFISLKANDGDVLTINDETAKTLVTEGMKNPSVGGAGVIAELGEMEGDPVRVKVGRFGRYINWRKVNARLPSEYHDDPSTLPLEDAWELIQAKASKPSKKKGKAKKEKSDLPPSPKRPPSAYVLFCAAKRAEVASKFDSFGEVSKELARLWGDASETDKHVFVEQASLAKAAYEEEKIKYDEKTRKTKTGKRKVKGEKKDNRPAVKRPRSAYILFCKDKRPEVAEDFDTLGQISKELAKRWASLDDDSKEKYTALAEEDKQRYEKEKALIS